LFKTSSWEPIEARLATSLSEKQLSQSAEKRNGYTIRDVIVWVLVVFNSMLIVRDWIGGLG